MLFLVIYTHFPQEIRLELDDGKLNAIIMELDILHRAAAPEIVDFYGAFFIESCVRFSLETLHIRHAQLPAAYIIAWSTWMLGHSTS